MKSKPFGTTEMQIMETVVAKLKEKDFDIALLNQEAMEDWINTYWDWMCEEGIDIEYGGYKACVIVKNLDNWVLKYPFKGFEDRAAQEHDTYLAAIDENVDNYFAAMYELEPNIYACEYAAFMEGEAEGICIDYLREYEGMDEDDVDWDKVEDLEGDRIIIAMYGSPQPRLSEFLEQNNITDLWYINWGRSLEDGRIVCRDYGGKE